MHLPSCLPTLRVNMFTIAMDKLRSFASKVSLRYLHTLAAAEASQGLSLAFHIGTEVTEALRLRANQLFYQPCTTAGRYYYRILTCITIIRPSVTRVPGRSTSRGISTNNKRVQNWSRHPLPIYLSISKRQDSGTTRPVPIYSITGSNALKLLSNLNSGKSIIGNHRLYTSFGYIGTRMDTDYRSCHTM